ncbi:3873_t:CDS:2, partial [Scutellospora calospora]
VQPGIPPRIPGPPHLHRNNLVRSLPFSGTGFRLTNNQPNFQLNSDDNSDDDEKRQRIAEAVQARARTDDTTLAENSQYVKHGVRREVGTLKSRCAYCVAGG